MIIDCNEFFCQKLSSLTIESSLFYHYKHHITSKGIVGISQSGAITFMSELYDGCTSDVEIVKNVAFWTENSGEKMLALLGNRGFTIKKNS